jgi:hypothetical protein
LVSIPYTAYPSIPNLTLTWGDWLVGASGVTIQAQLSGEIDIHISADPLVVDPALHLSGLPVTITFGADWTGDATILPSQVVVASVGDYSDISGCGALGWCDGLFSSQIDGKVQSQLQSQLHDQFLIALNGQSDAGPPPSPFWIGFLTAVANSPLMQPTDPADNPLPKPDAGQPGGITSSWQCVGDVVLTSNGVSASFQSSAGLCFIDCTPKTAQQLCSQPNPCAQMNDGCGDLVACPGVCDGPGDTCYDNQCQVCVPQTCASRGIECGSMSTGCGYAIDCGGCPNGAECNANGQCVGGRGAGKGCFGKTCM